MKKSIKRTLVFFIIMFAVIMISSYVKAATISETTQTNDGKDTIADNTIVIGISKFTPNQIVTGVKAATAGANDMKVYVAQNGSDANYTYPKMYYYTLGDWYEYNAEGALTESADITPYDIYYVNNKAKEGIEIPTIQEPVEETKEYTVFFINDKEYETRKVAPGECVSDLPEFTKENCTFDKFVDKDGNIFDNTTTVDGDIAVFATWKITTATVTNEEELKVAIANEDITTIKLGKSFEVDDSVVISRSVTIDGTDEKYTISKSGNPTFVSGGPNYIFKLGYGETRAEILIKNMKLTNNMAAILVANNAEVTVENVDVTGNVWGGIEVSYDGSLVINSITMTDETFGKPIAWIDTASKDSGANVTFAENIGNEKVDYTEDGKDQYHYYTNLKTVKYDRADETEPQEEKVVTGQKLTRPENPTREGYLFKGWNLGETAYNFDTPVTENITLTAIWKSTTAIVENEEQLNGAIADGEITTIKLGKSFEVDASVVVSRSVTIDGTDAKYTISKSGNPTFISGGPNYIFKLGYGETKAEILIKNMKLTNNMAAILVANNAEVTVENVDVTGNVWGGIEVANNGSLVINSITMTDETFGKPIAWIDTASKDSGANVTFAENIGNEKVDYTEDGKDQYHYYTNLKTVKYDKADETEPQEVKVVTGQKLTRPENPTREGYLFKGWNLGETAYNFDTPVTENITLTATWKSTTAIVENEEQLNGAIADGEITTIKLGKSFEVDDSVVISRSITIDGTDAKYTISKSGNPTFISGGPNYIFKLGYGETKAEILIKNMKLTNNMAAILVANNAEVTVENVDTTGNVWGGIEVADNGSLVVNSIIMADEAFGKPVVWVDTASIGTAEISYAEAKMYETKGQNHYYTKILNELLDVESFENLVTLTVTENIELTGDLRIPTNLTLELKKPLTVNSNVTVDLNGQKISSINAEGAIINNGNLILKDNSQDKYGIIETTLEKAHVIVNNSGATLIVESGTYDAKGHKSATIVNKGGEVTIDGGTFTRSNEAGVNKTNNGGNSYYTVENFGKMTINGGVFKNNGHYSSMLHNGYYSVADYSKGSNTPTLVINGGTYTGGINTIKNDDKGVIEIIDGTFIGYTQCVLMNWNIATIKGGQFIGTGVECAIYNAKCTNSETNDYSYDQGILTISGGTFIAPDNGYAIRKQGGQLGEVRKVQGSTAVFVGNKSDVYTIIDVTL